MRSCQNFWAFCKGILCSAQGSQAFAQHFRVGLNTKVNEPQNHCCGRTSYACSTASTRSIPANTRCRNRFHSRTVPSCRRCFTTSLSSLSSLSTVCEKRRSTPMPRSAERGQERSQVARLRLWGKLVCVQTKLWGLP